MGVLSVVEVGVLAPEPVPVAGVEVRGGLQLSCCGGVGSRLVRCICRLRFRRRCW